MSMAMRKSPPHIALHQESTICKKKLMKTPSAAIVPDNSAESWYHMFQKYMYPVMIQIQIIIIRQS